jgi:hypothetical protein
MFPRRFGSERLLVFPFPRQPNCSPGGRGENVCLASLSHNRQMAFQVFWERASAWFPSPTAAKWLSKWSGREGLLGFPPPPQPPNGSPGGLGENVCLVSLSHSRQNGSPGGLGENVCLVSLSHNRQMAFLVAWEKASARLPSPTTSKWLSGWSGRECLLGCALPQPPNGFPSGLGENVCLVSLPHNRQMGEKASAWFPTPTTSKSLSGWSGRKCLLGFSLPQPPNGSPSGLG